MPPQKRKLTIGRRAPDFALPATGGTILRLSDFRGKKQVVLAFYCLDWTAG
jgi:peroxiredoxin Q/BCP